jgi:hypothetical protein
MLENFYLRQLYQNLWDQHLPKILSFYFEPVIYRQDGILMLHRQTKWIDSFLRFRLQSS